MSSCPLKIKSTSYTFSLNWTSLNSLLAYSMNMGVGNDTPLVLNLAIIKLTFGLSINISVAQVISLLTAIVFFVIISRYME